MKGNRGAYRLIIVICALVLVIVIGSIYFFGQTNSDEVKIDKNLVALQIENGVQP